MGELVAMLLAFVAVVFALALAASLLAAWGIWRFVRRRLRWGQRVSAVRMWTAAPGPRREIAALRRELAAAVTSTPQAVALVKANAGVVGELPRLARGLERVAATLDTELRLLATEPDPAEVARVLPAARARVADVSRVGRSIRRAAGAGLGAQGAADVRALGDEVRREVAALAAGVEQLVSGAPATR